MASHSDRPGPCLPPISFARQNMDTPSSRLSGHHRSIAPMTAMSRASSLSYVEDDKSMIASDDAECARPVGTIARSLGKGRSSALSVGRQAYANSGLYNDSDRRSPAHLPRPAFAKLESAASKQVHHYATSTRPSFSHEQYAQPIYRDTPGDFYSPPAIQSAHAVTSARKRGNRASQACDQCRLRKSKCDEGLPCTLCKQLDTGCTYQEGNGPVKSDKSASTALSEVLDAIRVPMKSIEEKLDNFNRRLARFEENGPQYAADDQIKISRPMAPSVEAQASHELLTDKLFGFDNFDEHTTAAHKLIDLWPSIHDLLAHDLPPKDYVHEGEASNYVHSRDSRHPTLRDQFSADASPSITDATPSFMLETESLLDRHDVQHITRHDTSLEGLGHDGKLDLRPSVVRRLFEQYRSKIYLMHPFLDVDTISRYVDAFLDASCTVVEFYPERTSNIADAADCDHVDSHDSHNTRGIKRKRSQSQDADHRNSDASQSRTGSRPRTSLGDAIFLLILALGKVVDQSRETMHTHVKGVVGGSVADVAPGLACYREACSILGYYSDSNDVACAQARLLAGLYKAQLAKVRDSWSWIHDASRICRYHIIMEGLNKGSPRLYDEKVTERINTLLLVSWSCLQLESDILAEYDYPHSGLSVFEANLAYPRLRLGMSTFQDTAWGEDANKKIEDHYSGMLYLRKRLNEMHVNLYGQSLASNSPARLAEVLGENEAALHSWKQMSVRNTVSIDDWTDDDAPPHACILTARIRAKYYGARYIALRPFLHYALHAMDQVKAGRTLHDVARDSRGLLRGGSLALFQAIRTMDESVIKQKASLCVQSAIRSTIAFDQVPGKLVLTNIVGTAHAQFGNILVLSATHRSGTPWLRELVPTERLQWLMNRTIAFLDRLQHMSPTAKMDHSILQKVQRLLFGSNVEESRADSKGTTEDVCVDSPQAI